MKAFIDTEGKGRKISSEYILYREKHSPLYTSWKKEAKRVKEEERKARVFSMMGATPNMASRNRELKTTRSKSISRMFIIRYFVFCDHQYRDSRRTTLYGGGRGERLNVFDRGSNV